VALPRVGHRARQGHGVGASGRHEPVDLAGPHRLQPVAGRPQRRTAQPLRHRGERKPPAGRETAGAHSVGPGALDQRGQLVQQSALADAGLAGDQNETGLPGHGLVPALKQQRQVAFAANQPQRADRRDRADDQGRCRRWGQACHRGRLAARQPFVFGCGRPIRRDPKLTLQNRGAPVVGLQGGRPVPGQGLQLQQCPVPDLLKRLEIDPPPGPLDRLSVRTGVPLGRDQLVQQRQAPAVQPVPLHGHPVVIQRGHQLAAIRPHGVGRGPPERALVSRRERGRRLIGGGLEDGDIHQAVTVGPPQQRAALRGQPPVHLREPNPQRVQLPAQVRAGLGLTAIRPELGRDVVPALRRARVNQQEAEQGHGPRRLQCHHHRAVHGDPLLAEQ
jgi:hypothetical protein